MARFDTGVPIITSLDDSGRLSALDILRGLALFFMILVHFHQRMRLEVPGIEDLIGWAIYVLVEQKAWGTFAFLFGAGFAVLLRRLEAKRLPVAPIFLRRLAALALFGIVADLCFGFRILFTYAAWGVVLLLVRRWSTRALLAVALFAACAVPVYAESSALYSWWTGAVTTASNPIAALTDAVQAASHQSNYLMLLSARWALFTGTFPEQWADLLPDTNLPLFLLGFLAIRHGILDDPVRHQRLVRGWMTYGAVAWALFWLVLRRLPEMAIPGARWPVAFGFGLLQDQWLCLTYIGAIVLLLAHRPVWVARLSLFGEAGRMALTNYMLQAAVLDFLASGYGLALRLRPLLYAPAAVLMFSAVAFASRAWLSRFRFGPLEWLWRSVTYARIQPLRRGVVRAEPAAL
jgi:uncharacterized protein